jgi:replicative DNA helicase
MGKLTATKEKLEQKKNPRNQAEEALLGLLLNYEVKIKEIDENIFISLKNKEILNAIQFVSELSDNFSVENVGLTLSNRFKNREWMDTVSSLYESQKNGKKEDVDLYKKILRDESIKDKAQKILSNVNDEIGKNNLSSIKHAANELQQIDIFEKSYSIEMDKAVENSLFMLEENMKSETGFVGIETGIETLDDVTGGFHKKDLIIVAARPGQGKTSSVINFLSNNDHAEAGFITSEMPYEQLVYRMIALRASINAQKFRSPKYITEEELIVIKNMARVLAERKIYINDKPAITMHEIAEQARRWKEENDIKILYVDYLQRIRYEGKGFEKMPRNEKVGMIAQESKELAKELGIPVVQLAQLKRGSDKNKDEKPSMDDLKDSGMIEQEADLIMYLHKDATPKEEIIEVDDMEIGILKSRHGPIGIIPCEWHAQYMKIKEKIEYELPY